MALENTCDITDLGYPIQALGVGFLASKDFQIIWLLNMLALRVPDEDYSRNSSSVLNLISTFLLQI
jgi:hypothetical protein